MMVTAERYPDVFDLGLALSSVGGDHEFLTELVGLAQAAWPTLLAKIQSGMARGDLHAVETAAHLAKVAAQNVAAKRAYESALQLEATARQGDLHAVQSASMELGAGGGDCSAPSSPRSATANVLPEVKLPSDAGKDYPRAGPTQSKVIDSKEKYEFGSADS